MDDEKGTEENNGWNSMDVSEKQQNGKHIPEPESACPMTRFQIMRNLAVMSCGFLLLFTSFQSLSNLQSTLNKEEGLGVYGLAVIYGALIISCMFLPPFIVARLGCKWTVSLSMLGYILYMVANLYATWATIIPTAVILGLCAAPLWSAKCTYLTQIGLWYANMTGATADATINRFFGIFFMAFQSSQIWGNLISSTVFGSSSDNSTNSTDDVDLSTCGANFCPVETNNTNLDKPDMDLVYIVCGIYVAFAAAAFILVTLLLQPITLDKESSTKQKKPSPKLLVATFAHWWNSTEQKLLVPITIYSGIEQAFIGADYTKSFISCSMGISNIGYIMICYGVTDALCSFGFGRLVQYIGHIPFFVLVFFLHGGLQVAFLMWQPDPDMVILFYVFAALWGMGDAIIQTQVNALYGYLFSDNTEAAFANYRLWESLGFIVAFIYSNLLCTDIKLYISLSFLVVGVTLYGVTEFVHRKRKGDKYDLGEQ